MTDPIVKLRRSDVPGKRPLETDIETAELAYNTYDGVVYAKRERPGLGTDIVEVGIGVTITNVIYVTKNGSTTNSGKRIGDAKSTIKSAVGVATAGTVIRVAAGSYIENNPIYLPENVSIVGDDLSSVNVILQNEDEDGFYLHSGSHIENISFNGSTTGAVFSFPNTRTTNISKTPIIKNCSNYVTGSIGANLNGNLINGDYKSAIFDSYNQYNQGGNGITVTNGAYAKVFSSFTVCNDKPFYVGSGGVCSLISCSSSFGNYGLYADGVSSNLFVGSSSTTYSANNDTFQINNLGANYVYDGLVLYFGTLYYTVGKINITNGGSGYTSRPTVTISAPSESWGITASAVATITNGTVTEIEIVSNGRGYTTIPTITIEPPSQGINTASAEAVLSPIYYSVKSATKTSSGISTITLGDTVPYSVPSSTSVYFYKQSRILASNHTFEYVGSGTNLSTALPSLGGIAIQENEVVMENGGLVVFSSVDHSGNVRIGEGVVIDQTAGKITGDAYTTSLFDNITPLILALGGGE